MPKSYIAGPVEVDVFGVPLHPARGRSVDGVEPSGTPVIMTARMSTQLPTVPAG